MKRQHIALATSLLAGLLPQAAQACGDGAYIGQVCFMATPFCPHGTLEANGRAVNISQYQALYSLLATTYGGDGKATFNLPDLSGRSPRGLGTSPGLTLVQIGSKGGTSTNTLTIEQMPSHTHSASFTPAAFNVTASLPVSSSLGDVSILSSGPGYLAGLDGNAGKTDVDMKGPYTKTAPPEGSATLPVTTQVNYDANGTGDVTVGLAGGSKPFSIDSPYLGLKACIVVDGIYPQRP